MWTFRLLCQHQRWNQQSTTEVVIWWMKKCDMPKAKKRHYDDTEKKNQMKTLNLLLTLLKFKSLSISCIVEVEKEEKSLKAKTAKMKTKLLLIFHKSQLSDGLFYYFHPTFPFFTLSLSFLFSHRLRWIIIIVDSATLLRAWSWRNTSRSHCRIFVQRHHSRRLLIKFFGFTRR